MLFCLLDHTDPTVALSHGHDSLNKNRLKQNIMLQDLEPLELQSLHELVSLVHDHVNEGQPVGCSSIETAGVETNDQMDNRKEVFHNFQEDPVANLIWTLNPLMLRIVFVAMAVSSLFLFTSITASSFLVNSQLCRFNILVVPIFECSQTKNATYFFVFLGGGEWGRGLDGCNCASVL